jgi:hypothetical protein
MPGKITRIAVTYTLDTVDGPRHTFHGLREMRQHIRADRLTELLDDLTVVCDGLVASRRAASERPEGVGQHAVDPATRWVTSPSASDAGPEADPDSGPVAGCAATAVAWARAGSIG